MQQNTQKERLPGESGPEGVGKYVELMIDVFDAEQPGGKASPGPSPVEPNFGGDGGKFGSGGKGKRRESWRRDSIEDVFPKTPNGQSFLKGKSADDTWRSNSEDEDYLPEGMANHLRVEEDAFVVIDEEPKEGKIGADTNFGELASTEKGLAQTLVIERAQPKLQVIDEEQSYELDMSRTVEANAALHELSHSQSLFGSVRRPSDVSQFIIPQIEILSVEDIDSRRGSFESEKNESTNRANKHANRPSRFKSESVAVPPTLPAFQDSQALQLSNIPLEDNQQTVRITFPPGRLTDIQTALQPLRNPVSEPGTDRIKSSQNPPSTGLETTFKAELRAKAELKKSSFHSSKHPGNPLAKAAPEDAVFPRKTINIIQNTNYFININQTGRSTKNQPQAPKAIKTGPNQFSFKKKSKPVFDDRSAKAPLLSKSKTKPETSSQKHLASFDQKHPSWLFKPKKKSRILSESDGFSGEQHFNIYLPKGQVKPVVQHKRQRSTSFESSVFWARNVTQKQALMTGNASLVLPRPEPAAGAANFAGRASLKTTPRTPTTADAKRSKLLRQRVYQDDNSDALQFKKTSLDVALLRVMSGMAKFDGTNHLPDIFENDSKQQRSNISEHKEQFESQIDNRFTQSVNMRNAYMRGNPTPVKESSGSELETGKYTLRSTVGARFGESLKDTKMHASDALGSSLRGIGTQKRASVEGLKKMLGNRASGRTTEFQCEKPWSNDLLFRAGPVLKRQAVGRGDNDRIFMKAETANRPKQMSQRTSAREEVNSVFMRNNGFLSRVKQSIK